MGSKFIGVLGTQDPEVMTGGTTLTATVHSCYCMDDVTIYVMALALGGGSCGVQVSPYASTPSSGTEWVTLPTAVTAVGPVALTKPAYRVRVILSGAATGEFVLLKEKRL